MLHETLTKFSAMKKDKKSPEILLRVPKFVLEEECSSKKACAKIQRYDGVAFKTLS